MGFKRGGGRACIAAARSGDSVLKSWFEGACWLVGEKCGTSLLVIFSVSRIEGKNLIN